MPGFFNKPRPTPKSGQGAVDNALNLLASFGGGNDDLKKLLQETKAAIAYNEKLISDAQNIIEQAKDIDRREERLAKTEAEVDAKLARLTEIGAGFREWDSR